MTVTARGRFRTFQGVIDIPLTVQADGPLLIKGPQAALPDRPDAAFVRYPGPDGRGQVPFLPGSSLKGVLRSGAEALLAALGEVLCDALDPRASWCSSPRAERRPGARPGRCAACYTFGCQQGASVVLVEDGLPWRPGDPPEVRAERAAALERRAAVRTGVAVNRRTGAAESQRLFDYEVLVGAAFYPTVRLRNPLPWQAALVAAALRLLDDGTLRLGSGTTRGLGRVRARPDAVTARYLGEGGRLAALLAEGGLDPAGQDGLLAVRRAADPVATLERWSAALPGWLAAWKGEGR